MVGVKVDLLIVLVHAVARSVFLVFMLLIIIGFVALLQGYRIQGACLNTCMRRYVFCVRGYCLIVKVLVLEA